MEIFNVIVGIATIISTVCTVISMCLLHSLNITVQNNGDNNNSLHNYGRNNSNVVVTGHSNLNENSNK